ncbi:uncharacterized protein N7479_009429, partial [Penicillium vulpinum]|uniref:uncharacterized protein n=1 Tax=Penicillium vulpinum TaxID=29845 RepID=UPI0025483DBA
LGQSLYRSSGGAKRTASAIERRRKKPLYVSVSLNVISDSLTFYRGKIYTAPTEPLRARILLDSGASNTFVSLYIITKLGGTAKIRKPKTPLIVTVANRKHDIYPTNRSYIIVKGDTYTRITNPTEEKYISAALYSTEAYKSAFRKIKGLLISALVLKQPDRNKLYTIKTDISEWDDEGILYPVVYNRRKLYSTELNYPVYKKELLTIKKAILSASRAGSPSSRNIGVPEEDWLAAIIRFLEDRTEPDDRATARAVKRFTTNLSFRDIPIDKRASPEVNRQLIYTYTDGEVSLYLEPPFRTDLILNTYKEFSYLGFPGLYRIIRPRGYLEREEAQYIVVVIRTVPDATEEVIAEFLYRDIYVYYSVFTELILDNSPNLLSGVVRYFTELIKA